MKQYTGIDLFAGGGGFTTGARKAGVRVLWAANHWKLAVTTHEENHPDTIHVCQDLHQVDWRTAPRHDILLASPACQGHSDALSHDLPYHDALRATAWAVVSCLEVHRSETFIVENVPGFLRWELLPSWLSALRCLGYEVTTQVLNAADFGVAQSRKRAFIVGTRRGQAIHLETPGREHKGAGTFIDWNAGNWMPVRAPKRSPMVLMQWENGRKVHGRRFLIGYHSDKKRGVSLDIPIGTITTKDQWAVVNGDRYRMLRIEEYRKAMGFSSSYVLPDRKTDALKMLGNAVPPPMAAGVVRQVARAMGAR